MNLNSISQLFCVLCWCLVSTAQYISASLQHRQDPSPPPLCVLVDGEPFQSESYDTTVPFFYDPSDLQDVGVQIITFTGNYAGPCYGSAYALLYSNPKNEGPAIANCSVIPVDGYEHISSCSTVQRGTIPAGPYGFALYYQGISQEYYGGPDFTITHAQQTMTSTVSTFAMTPTSTSTIVLSYTTSPTATVVSPTQVTVTSACHGTTATISSLTSTKSTTVTSTAPCKTLFRRTDAKVRAPNVDPTEARLLARDIPNSVGVYGDGPATVTVYPSGATTTTVTVPPSSVYTSTTLTLPTVTSTILPSPPTTTIYSGICVSTTKSAPPVTTTKTVTFTTTPRKYCL